MPIGLPHINIHANPFENVFGVYLLILQIPKFVIIGQKAAVQFCKHILTQLLVATHECDQPFPHIQCHTKGAHQLSREQHTLYIKQPPHSEPPSTLSFSGILLIGTLSLHLSKPSPKPDSPDVNRSIPPGYFPSASNKVSKTSLFLPFLDSHSFTVYVSYVDLSPHPILSPDLDTPSYLARVVPPNHPTYLTPSSPFCWAT